jgi:hypothetical protein
LEKKSILVSHGFRQLENGEDRCAIGLVDGKLYLFPIATRYKKVCHSQIEYTHFAKMSLSLNIELV